MTKLSRGLTCFRSVPGWADPSVRVFLGCTEPGLFSGEVPVMPARTCKSTAAKCCRASMCAGSGSRVAVLRRPPQGVSRGAVQPGVQPGHAAVRKSRPFRAGRRYDPVVQTGKSCAPATTKTCCGRRLGCAYAGRRHYQAVKRVVTTERRQRRKLLNAQQVDLSPGGPELASCRDRHFSLSPAFLRPGSIPAGAVSSPGVFP